MIMLTHQSLEGGWARIVFGKEEGEGRGREGVEEVELCATADRGGIRCTRWEGWGLRGPVLTYVHFR